MKTPEIPTPVVRLSHVSKIFGADDNRTVALDDVSLDASAGELLLVLGPSGSGKTTLLTLMAGLLKSTSGTVFLFGKEMDSYSAKELQHVRANRIGFIFQTFLLIDSLTVQENVAVVLRFAGKSRREANRQAQRLLDQFHVGHLAQKFPRILSQGEKQRVAVARACANNGDLIIADEPTGCLESTQGLEIIRLLKTYSRDRNRCVIVASHDLRIGESADGVLRLEDGRLSSVPRRVESPIMIPGA